MIDSTAAADRLFFALYRDHHRWLQAWLTRRLSCTEHAADLAQDTFVRLLSSPALLAPREPRPLLATIAKRLLIDHSRRRSLELAYLDALATVPETHAPSEEERLLILDSLHQVDAMLDRLQPQVRTAFLLSQLEGLSYAEIAQRLDISERSVKRYMARAYEECILLL